MLEYTIGGLCFDVSLLILMKPATGFWAILSRNPSPKQLRATSIQNPEKNQILRNMNLNSNH
jgi:hypothetical protein